MSEIVEQPKRPIGLLVWLIVSQMIALGSLVIWLAMAGLSFMAFDSGESLGAYAFVLAVWCYPVFPIGMSIGAWIAYSRRKNRLAAILSGASFAPILCLYGYFWISNLG